MNAEKLTQKSREAISAAQSVAVEHSHQQIDQIHLLYALVSQENGLIGSLIQKMNIDKNAVLKAVEDKINSMPSVYVVNRPSDSVYITADLDRAINFAEKTAQKMKDSFVSVEHLMIGIIETANADVKKILGQFEIEKNKFLKVLSEVRGNERVNTENPEETYDVLKKYGQDLVEAARNNKLDPVIGRDDEIRNVIRILSR